MGNRILEQIRDLPPEVAKKTLIEIFSELKKIKPMDSVDIYYERVRSIIMKLEHMPVVSPVPGKISITKHSSVRKTRVGTPLPVVGGNTRKQRQKQKGC